MTAVILATKTRKVTIKAINDSKDVIDIVFIVVFASIAMLVFSYVLQDYSNIGDGLYMAALLLATTGTITFAFIPKVHKNYYIYYVYRCLCLDEVSIQRPRWQERI